MSSLHLECSSSIFINRDGRNLKSQNPQLTFWGLHTLRFSCAPDFPTGTSTVPQKTFEKPTFEDLSRSGENNCARRCQLLAPRIGMDLRILGDQIDRVADSVCANDWKVRFMVSDANRG